MHALRVSDDAAVKRAVFFDSAFVSISQSPNSADISRYLANRGYEIVNAQSLAAFLDARIADRAPSVVVFAIDALPGAVAGAPVASSTFRRYLANGGKVVWSGLPPATWPVQPGKERGGLHEVAWNAPTELLGVPHDEALFDVRTARVTDDGKRWGLAPKWRTAWSVSPGGARVPCIFASWCAPRRDCCSPRSIRSRRAR